MEHKNDIIKLIILKEHKELKNLIQNNKIDLNLLFLQLEKDQTNQYKLSDIDFKVNIDLNIQEPAKIVNWSILMFAAYVNSFDLTLEFLIENSKQILKYRDENGMNYDTIYSNNGHSKGHNDVSYTLYLMLTLEKHNEWILKKHFDEPIKMINNHLFLVKNRLVGLDYILYKHLYQYDISLTFDINPNHGNLWKKDEESFYMFSYKNFFEFNYLKESINMIERYSLFKYYYYSDEFLYVYHPDSNEFSFKDEIGFHELQQGDVLNYEKDKCFIISHDQTKIIYKKKVKTLASVDFSKNRAYKKSYLILNDKFLILGYNPMPIFQFDDQSIELLEEIYLYSNGEGQFDFFIEKISDDMIVTSSKNGLTFWEFTLIDQKFDFKYKYNVQIPTKEKIVNIKYEASPKILIVLDGEKDSFIYQFVEILKVKDYKDIHFKFRHFTTFQHQEEDSKIRKFE